MSRANAYIKFNDTGHLYFGGYNGTVDYMKSNILLITKETVKKYSVSDICLDGIRFYYEDEPDDYTREELESMCKNSTDCEIYTDYGGGYYWKAKGYERNPDTFSIITKNLSPYEDDFYESEDEDDTCVIHGEPDWMNDVRALIQRFRKE